MEIVGALIEWLFGAALFLAVGWLFIILCAVGAHALCGMAGAALLFYGIAAVVFLIYEAATGFKHVDIEKLASWWYSGKHAASDLVKRPHREAAEEFARVLEAQHFDDLRARELFSQLGPLRQRIWRARYEERTKAAKQLREMLEAQTKAMHADADLGESILQRERTYRAGRHR